MTESGGRGDPTTDVPPRDRPSDERDDPDKFLESFLVQGAEYTDELLRENEQLQRMIRDLEAENTALRRQLVSDTAVLDLSSTEEELERLANLHVASFALNATLKLDLVVRHVHELLGQLVGSRCHSIYIVDEGRAELVCIAREGLGGRDARTLRIGELSRDDSFALAVERVFLTGVPHFAEDPHEAPDLEPAACVPLHVDDRIVGVIVVHSVLRQKLTFMPVDFELFKLLSAHAGTAIVGAQLFDAAGRKLPPPRSIASVPLLAGEAGTSRSNNNLR